MFEQGLFGLYSWVLMVQVFCVGKGVLFVVVVNYFKFKGCLEVSGVDVDQKDDQVCWNVICVDFVWCLDQWLCIDLIGVGIVDVVLLGDFNVYVMEDLICILYVVGWYDVFVEVKVVYFYSYVYNGMSGWLDYVLLSLGMVKCLCGVVEWYINVDEVDDVGYCDCNVFGLWCSFDYDLLLFGFDW